MLALALCVLAFILTYWAGKHSLGKGVVVLLIFGFFYGILRANLLTTFSHFIFDAGIFGLYLSQFVGSGKKTARLSDRAELPTIGVVWRTPSTTA